MMTISQLFELVDADIITIGGSPFGSHIEINVSNENNEDVEQTTANIKMTNGLSISGEWDVVEAYLKKADKLIVRELDIERLKNLIGDIDNGKIE